MTRTHRYSRVFEVSFTTIVDRPELRGPSLPVVPAGHRIHDTYVFETQAQAIALFNAMVGGEWDFGSEFLARVQVLDVRDGNRSIARAVRKPVERTRASKAAA